jgi:hypothetical protein
MADSTRNVRSGGLDYHHHCAQIGCSNSFLPVDYHLHDARTALGWTTVSLPYRCPHHAKIVPMAARACHLRHDQIDGDCSNFFLLAGYRPIVYGWTTAPAVVPRDSHQSGWRVARRYHLLPRDLHQIGWPDVRLHRLLHDSHQSRWLDVRPRHLCGQNCWPDALPYHLHLDPHQSRWPDVRPRHLCGQNCSPDALPYRLHHEAHQIGWPDVRLRRGFLHHDPAHRSCVQG